MSLVQIFRGTLIFTLLIMMGVLFSPFFIPLFIGALAGVVFFPIYTWLLRRKLPSVVAAVLVVVGFNALIVAPFGVVVVKGAKNTIRFLNNNLDKGKLSPTGEERMEQIESLADKAADFLWFDLPRVESMLMEVANNVGSKVFAFLTDIVSRLPEFFIGALISIVTMYFCLVDHRDTVRRLVSVSLLPSSVAHDFLADIAKSCRNVVIANVVTGAIQALLIASAAVISDSGGFFVVWFVTFVLSFIPLIGAAPIAFLLGLVQLASGNSSPALAMMIVGLVAGTVDNFIRPWLLSGSDDIHPLISLIAVFGGIIFFGPVGIFIGPLLYLAARALVPLYFTEYEKSLKS